MKLLQHMPSIVYSVTSAKSKCKRHRIAAASYRGGMPTANIARNRASRKISEMLSRGRSSQMTLITMRKRFVRATIATP